MKPVIINKLPTVDWFDKKSIGRVCLCDVADYLKGI